MSIAYLNGDYLPLTEAKISVLDRGFTFGDGVYEVLPVYCRRIFRLNEHLSRLDNSLVSIYIKNPMSQNEWREMLITLVDKNPEDDQSLYVQVTRGISERDHSINPDLRPTIFAMSKPLAKHDYTNGIAAVTCEDIRWSYCHIKAITLLPGVLLRQQAAEKGATEAILLKDNLVTEGAASNVFIVKDEIVITPPKNGNLLPGITRDLVIELLVEAGIQCREINISKDALIDADEIWITSSTLEIVPVVKLDDNLIHGGCPGLMWAKANEIYQTYKNNIILVNDKYSN